MIAKTVFEVTLNLGKKIPVEFLPHISEPIAKKVYDCKKFQDYVSRMKEVPTNVSISKIEIVNVEMFGERVGFVSLKAHTSRDGHSLPNFVFLRGPAVAILMFVNGKLLLVEQYRVPVQQLMLEAPAGMLDESGDFVGVAAAEIQEETSIKISKQNLKPLGSFYPSVGGCDEELLMFECSVEIPQERMEEIEAKIHGKEGEQERIKVKFVDYSPELVIGTKDSKLICMMYAHESRKKTGPAL